MDVRQFAFLVGQPSAALKKRDHFLGLPKRGLAFLLANVMFWQPLWAQADGIVVSAPGTTLGQAANGVPVVNIAAPNASGLSHNQFHDYNVGSQGLILNNSTQNLQSTQLGGYIIGNSNLNGRAASTILNEVNGGSQSQLRGYTEVAGQSAHVIVANPYGITCNGCGFINTPQATLTTGKAVITNGQVSGYQVEGGSVSIEGARLNASNIDRFEIITRSAKLNAEIQAKNLAIITGANDVDAKTLKATARAADPATAPQLAIDSSALGGMYAGAIKLVGTEAGVGVKLDGNLVASGGDIQLDANGKLSLARVSAKEDLNLKAQDIALTDSVNSGKDTQVVAANALDIDKNLTSVGNLHLEGQQIVNRGQLNAGLNEDGSTNSDSHLQLQGGSLSNQGKIAAHGTLSTDLQRLDNRNAELVASGTATLKAATLDNRTGKLGGQQALTVEGTSLDNRGGTIASNQALKIVTGQTLSNSENGLILSRSDGLKVDAGTLDNRGGTLQANTGELKAAATQQFDNSGGKVLTGAGKLTLTAGELRNQLGQLNAQADKLKINAATFDNGHGDTRAADVEVTSTSRLGNDQGHIVATNGDLLLKRGEVINDNGELSASQGLKVDSDSLRNRNGTLSARSIDLALAGELNNDLGLVEAGEVLTVDAGSVSNAGGKLRALGSQGVSRFGIAGQFNNDNGLVEIGNDRFALTSVGLSNQSGMFRHLGAQGFQMALADAGQAGGSFITNGELNLDLADWSNTSLIQARKIGLKVGTFTQTASGKLVSIESVEARGINWRNDGSLETQGDLQLNLTGSYQGKGALKSQGRMTLAAASADLGNGAEVRSGGAATFTLGSHLNNSGSLSSSGDLSLQVDSLTNSGSLGAGKALFLETPTVLNDGGLIFSGGDMTLRADSVTNNKGDLYSLGNLDIAAGDARPASLIENISGTIESAHGMRLLANRLINRKEKFAFIPALTSGHITLTGTDNCHGKHCEAYYYINEVYGPKVTEDSRRANLVAGGEFSFKGDSFENNFSTVSSGADLTVEARTLKNIGAGGGEQRYTAYQIYTKDDGAYYAFINNMGLYNLYNDPNSASYNPSSMPFTSIVLGGVTDYRVVQTSGAVEAAAALIQSAGKVSITGSQQVENSFVRAGETFVGGASRVGSTDVASNAQVLPQFNAQSAPDLKQKAVDPLLLPGFSLPEGQNGLFRVSADPTHRYLIETNPVFADRKQFTNSDYLLSRLGFDPDQAQRRLGDGLYEQRLIREAVTARTGQRFIAGLDNDDAMFRYLMDNAIASKNELNLAPGVGLTSAQVAALTHDIVWMEEQVVNGQKVLVPVLYLAQANDRLAPNGALIQGRDVAVISGGNLSNQGTLRASTNLQASGQNITNTGLMQANERLSLLATESIRNAQGGILKGGDVSLVASNGDIVNERSKVSQDTGYGGGSQHHDYLDNAARIESDNSLALAAGRDIKNSGSTLQSGGDATLKAGRDLLLVSTEQVDSSSGRFKKTSWNQSQTTQYGSQVQVGGNLSASAGQDIGLVASTVTAKQQLALAAGRDVSIASAANESHVASQGKKVKSSNDQVRQQSSVLQAGGDLSIGAGQDLTLVASQVKGAQNVALDADRDINVLSAKDESASFYSKKSKGSFGRSKSEQRESYDSTNVASVVEAGKDLTINASKGADGAMNINGGRDVTIIGSQLKAHDDLMVGAQGDVAVLSGVEEHGSYSKKTKSGFLGLSKSGKSQLKTTASQVGSELEAGNDVVVAAGNDIRLRASEATAGNDVELHAGVVNKDGDINLVSANDTAYSRSEQYKKKAGLSVSGGFISFASAKEAGKEAQSSTSVGSQVVADRDATLQAERDINISGSGVKAGRNVALNAGRDVNVVAAQNNAGQLDWKKKKQSGIGFSGDDNGISAFVGTETKTQQNRHEQQTAAASQIDAGENLTVNAKRDINQIGSDLKASNDIELNAGRNINIDAAREIRITEEQRQAERNGVGVTVNHNFGKTKDAIAGIGKGDDAVSQVSSVLKAVDAISQFLLGSTQDGKVGNSQQGGGQRVTEETSRASTLQAGNDIKLAANNDVSVKGSQFSAGRDINVSGRDVAFDIAREGSSQESLQRESWVGVHGGTSGGFKIGVGGSYGTAGQDSSRDASGASRLDAARDINLQASNDLTLIGTQAKAGRDIDLTAGNELNIRSAQNGYSSESNRGSGGGEVGFAFGSEGVGVYASVSLGKGNLEREGERQQEAYLYAGDRLSFTSGKDTNVSGATLRGDEVVGRVGGDLNVSSALDTGTAKGKEFDVNVTVTVGPGSGVSGSVGYGATTGKTNWVDRQTSITGKEKVDIRTENHTQIDGALIAADNGDLKLDTGTLGFSDIAGKDKEHGYYLNVGGSYNQSGSGGTAQDPSQVGKGEEGKTGWSVSGWNYEKDKEQIVRATVGAGDIIVRKDAETGGDSTQGLNRDVEKAYEVTRDKESRTDLYASGTSVGAVLDPGKTYDQWKRNVSLYGENSVEALRSLKDLLDTTVFLAVNINNINQASKNANDVINLNRNLRYLSSKDQARREEAVGYLFAGKRFDQLDAEAQKFFSGVAELAGQDPARAITFMALIARSQNPQGLEQQGFASVAAGAAVAGVALILVAAGASPENQARMSEAVNAAIRKAGESSSNALKELQVRLAIKMVEVFYGTTFPVHLLDDESRALVNPILEGQGSNPASGGYGVGSEPTTVPTTGGSPIADSSSGSYTNPSADNTSLGVVYSLPNGQSVSDFEASLVRLPSGERVAIVKPAAKAVADSLGWTKDNQLSRINGRDVYRGGDGFLYAVDTQHGRFEKVNSKNGAHMGEVQFDLTAVKGSKDDSGRHDLRIK